MHWGCPSSHPLVFSVFNKVSLWVNRSGRVSHQTLCAVLSRIKITHAIKRGASQRKVTVFFFSFRFSLPFLFFCLSKYWVWLMSALHHSESLSMCCVLTFLVSVSLFSQRSPRGCGAKNEALVTSELAKTAARWKPGQIMLPGGRSEKWGLFTKVFLDVPSHTSTLRESASAQDPTPKKPAKI